ncbi:GNAT family N-acetyltransferase [Halococcus agarilyticus]|uniref:GNAT family N-acetyltransferase n=1 Tax=Halococcus agarilyticus TaxID=1232219 RepID=UPI0006779338|nr:GNAT family N-acetyltransferase [Halococcus agarilyticus]
MTEGLRIRQYEPADRDAVLALHERALRDTGASVEDVPPEFEADLRDIADAYLDGEFVIGECDGDLVAMGGYRPAKGSPDAFERSIADPERTAELKRMRVAPAYQRHGFGTAVLGKLESSARERGFERMVLDTGPEMTAARSFYEGHGYGQTGRQTFRGGDIGVVFYEKELGISS